MLHSAPHRQFPSDDMASNTHLLFFEKTLEALQNAQTRTHLENFVTLISPIENQTHSPQAH